MSARIVVVGAGLGGLAVAIRLQARGHQVTLIEKRAQPGGRAGQLKAAGYTFDRGPSIITAPHLLRDLWAGAGACVDDDVNLVPLSPYYRIYFADGRHFDYGGPPEQVEAQLRAFDPDAVQGYHRFMAATQRIYQRAFEDLASQPFHKLATFLKLVPELVRLNAAQSVYSFVSRFFRDPQLRTVFSFHPLFIGGNPLRASAIYSIVPYLERQGGVWFARGGMYALVEAMLALFERLGGKTYLSTGVEEVLVDDATRTVSGVRLSSGDALGADAVVLNADVATAYRQLVPARYQRHMTDRRLRRYRYSMSCFLLYLGVDRQYPQLLHHTIIMSARFRGLLRDIFDGRGLPEDMSLYLHAPSRTDPSMAPPGGDSVYVLVPMPHLDRGIDWTRETQPFRDRIIRFLEVDFGLTGLEEAIRFEARFTPLDFRDDLSSHLGSAFSIEPDAAAERIFPSAQRLGGHRRLVPGRRRYAPRCRIAGCVAVSQHHEPPRGRVTRRPGSDARPVTRLPRGTMLAKVPSCRRAATEMLRRLGYACLCLSVASSSPRGTVLRNATPERLRGLIETNLAGLKRVLDFNAASEVRMFRLSSGLVPFGSHPLNALAWWDDFDAALRDIGEFIRREDLRVSMHPGQYTVMSSPHRGIVQAARADLLNHARLLDAFGLDTRHKIVVHVGGAYADKVAALQRWIDEVRQLPNAVRARLVVENDERLFGAEDVLAASAATGIPVVLDVLHHRVYAGADADATLPDLMRRVARTWQSHTDGVPKIHYSTQDDQRRIGAHAEYVDSAEFARFLGHAPAEVEFDCMLEAKSKDLAVFRLRSALGITA